MRIVGAFVIVTLCCYSVHASSSSHTNAQADATVMKEDQGDDGGDRRTKRHPHRHTTHRHRPPPPPPHPTTHRHHPHPPPPPPTHRHTTRRPAPPPAPTYPSPAAWSTDFSSGIPSPSPWSYLKNGQCWQMGSGVTLENASMVSLRHPGATFELRPGSFPCGGTIPAATAMGTQIANMNLAVTGTYEVHSRSPTPTTDPDAAALAFFSMYNHNDATGQMSQLLVGFNTENPDSVFLSLNGYHAGQPLFEHNFVCSGDGFDPRQLHVYTISYDQASNQAVFAIDHEAVVAPIVPAAFAASATPMHPTLILRATDARTFSYPIYWEVDFVSYSPDPTALLFPQSATVQCSPQG